MRRMTRRTFLRALGGAAAVAMLPKWPVATVWADGGELVAVPPSLMLHSPQAKGDYLVRVLAGLQENGFTATTYKGWLAAVREKRPLTNPIIISIDDLTLAEGSMYAWHAFRQMKEVLVQAGMVATYGVITTPMSGETVLRQQDAARWDLVADWVAAGFELASHTSFHSCFSNKESGPRSDFTQSDYDAEIVESAVLIERELQARGVANWQVDTLILPYGSGYSYMEPEPKVHDGIVAACQQTNIRLVVGIPQGREPFCADYLNDVSQTLYMGRIGPSVTADARLDPANTVAQLVWWAQKNAEFTAVNEAMRRGMGV